MTDTLLLILSIAGTIIVLLLTALGIVVFKALGKLDHVDKNVNSVLAVSGIITEQVKTHSDQIKDMQKMQIENANDWKILYKDYDLASIKN